MPAGLIFAVISSSNKPLDQNGSTFLPLLKQIYPACTKNTRRCVYAISWIQNGSTVRTPVKGAVSRPFPNTSRCAYTLDPLIIIFFLLNARSPDWDDYPNQHTVWWT